MHATLVLCLVQVGAGGGGAADRGISPATVPIPTASVQDAWKSFDFYGHYDDKGVFVYSRARSHRETAKNFGVDLSGHTPPIAGEVRGTDKDLGRDLAEAALKSSAPCPGPGPCPPRRPGPGPDPDPLPRLPVDPLSPWGPAGGLALLPLVVAAMLLLLSFFLVLTVSLFVLVRRRP